MKKRGQGDGGAIGIGSVVKTGHPDPSIQTKMSIR